MKRNYDKLLLVSLMLTSALTGQTFNWEEQIINNRSENLQGIAVSEDGSATIVGYGNTFVKSTDGGDSWHNTGIFETDNFDYQDISFSGNIGFAIAMTGYKVIDRPKGGGPDLYANSPLLKTTDGGVTWNIITVKNMGSGTDSTLNLSAIGNYNVKFSSMELIDANTLYISAFWKDINDSPHYNVFKTSDAGESWEPTIPDNGNNSISSITEHNGNIYLAGSKTLYKITIAKDSITDLYPEAYKHVNDDKSLFFWNPTIAGNEIIFPTTKHGILTTTNAGDSFEMLPNTIGANFVYKHNDSTYITGASTSKTKATTDGGKTWEAISANETLWDGGVIGDSLIALGKNEIFTMALSDIETGHFSWSTKTITPISGNLKSIATKGDTTFIVGYAGIFLRSTDGAQTFTEVTLPSKSNLIYASVDISLIGISQGEGTTAIANTRRYKVADYPTKGPDDIYVAGFLFSTTDNWNTFSVIDDTKIGAKYSSPSINPYANGCYAQEFNTANCINDSIFVTSVQWYHSDNISEEVTYGRVFKTSDAGQSWDTISSNLGNSFIKTIKTYGNDVFIGGNKTLLKSDDYGVTYTDLIPQLTALGASDPYIQEILKKGDSLYISTTSDSVFVSYDNGITFSKIEGPVGATTFVPVDANSWMTLGAYSKSMYTNYGGDSTWVNCYPGSPVFSSGIYADNIIALAKGSLFKLPLADLNSTIIAGIQEKRVTDLNNISITQSNTSLTISAKKSITQCRVYTITGENTKTINTNSTTVSINTSTLAKGIYIVNIKTNGANTAKKFIIK